MAVRSWLCSVAAFVVLTGSTGGAAQVKALIIDGQCNPSHDWKANTIMLKKVLESSGIFTVDIATSPPHGQDMASFKPNFAAYKVLVLNYDGDPWPAVTRSAFLNYVRSGGGVVVVHSADNAFTNWKEFNEIIGLGGWGGRTEKSGSYIRLREGKWIPFNAPGPAGHHGSPHPYAVVTRDEKHPVMAGLPKEWLHVKDELYDSLRGPAQNLTVLASAYSDPKTQGTGEDEPILFTIQYGKGRVFHTVLGHGPEEMKCVGFITTLERGTEWAATGKVTQKVPPDFPTASQVSVRNF
jgi:type 1 glutamine amidotransferase